MEDLGQLVASDGNGAISLTNEEDRRCKVEVGAVHVQIAFEVALSGL